MCQNTQNKVSISDISPIHLSKLGEHLMFTSTSACNSDNNRLSIPTKIGIFTF
jgi:hypothetical protein